MQGRNRDESAHDPKPSVLEASSDRYSSGNQMPPGTAILDRNTPRVVKMSTILIDSGTQRCEWTQKDVAVWQSFGLLINYE